MPMVVPLALLPKEALASPIAGTTTMLQHCLSSVRLLVQHDSAQGLWQPRKTSSLNISMIPHLNHPWLPLKMVLMGLPWVALLIWPGLDALFTAEEADAASSNLLPKAHQPAMDLLFWRTLHHFHVRDALAAAWLLELCHLLLHMLVGLALSVQLFFKLLDANESLLQSFCHICNVWGIVICIS